jgi:hypothetical protein
MAHNIMAPIKVKDAANAVIRQTLSKMAMMFSPCMPKYTGKLKSAILYLSAR